jgi:hypothetical protein
MSHILVLVEVRSSDDLERAMERHMRYSHPGAARGDGWTTDPEPRLKESLLVLKDGSSANSATVLKVDVAATRALFESRTVFVPWDDIDAPDILTIDGSWHGYHDGYKPDLSAWDLIEQMNPNSELIVVDVHE